MTGRKRRDFSDMHPLELTREDMIEIERRKKEEESRTMVDIYGSPPPAKIKQMIENAERGIVDPWSPGRTGGGVGGFARAVPVKVAWWREMLGSVRLLVFVGLLLGGLILVLVPWFLWIWDSRTFMPGSWSVCMSVMVVPTLWLMLGVGLYQFRKRMLGEE